MSSLVTQTKIIKPARRPELLTRQRLLDILVDLLDFRLIILAAPAGYGKTSLLIDFIDGSDIPACWYSLDPLDKDPQRFLAHFIASIQRCFPDFGESSQAMIEALNQESFDVARVVTTIVNDLYENVREHFLIVLDDYHLILGAKEIDTFINNFVQEAGENCHLILSSRTLLTLPDMPLMVARGLVSGLSYEELAFNASEIQSLAFQNYRMTLPTQVAIELAEETEGWITGLLLSTHRNWRGDLDQLRAARLSGVDLYDYLAQQVLDQQPSEVREFLLRTSLLEEFNEELCKQVIEPGGDITELMETVSKSNLFILPVGEDGRWMRYHHLFSDFLQTRMLREYPNDRDEILHRLADVYLEWGEYEKSYATYKRLRDIESTAELIAQVGSIFLNSGRLQTLTTWLEGIPEDVIIENPELNSLRGAVRVMQGSVEEGIFWLRQAEKAQRKINDQNGLSVTLIRLSSTLRFLGMYQDSLDKAKESLTLINASEEMKYPHAEALRSLGISLYHMGQLDKAAEKLIKSHEIYQSLGDRQNMALILMELGITSKIAGSYRKAQAYYEQALEIWRETQNPVGQANLLNNLAVLHHIMGEYVQAGALYEEGLKFSKLSGYSRMQAYILCGIGDLYVDIGAIDSARDAYKHAIEIAKEIQERFLLVYIKLKEASLARIGGKIDIAREILSSVELTLFGTKSLYEIGLWQLESGHLNAAISDYELACDYYSGAIDNFKNAGQTMDAVRSYLYLANVQYLNGYHNEALKTLSYAFELSSQLDTQKYLATAGSENIDLLKSFQHHVDIRPKTTELIEIVSNFKDRIPSIRRQLRGHASSIQFIAPELSIHTLGISQVKINGKNVTSVEWQNQRRVRELFFYLLEYPEGLTKEEVGLVLWPESSTSRMKLQFKNALYRLRYSLGQDVVLLNGERYYFNFSLDYVYDVQEFVSRLEIAQTVKDPVRKRKVLQAAVSYYKGHYLPDVDSTWVIPERERLWQMYAEGILTLAKLYLEAGENQRALEYSQQLIEQDPCQEEAHQIAMKAFAARGDRASVIRQFESCCKTLMNEIKAKPSKQTNELYQSLIK